MAQDGKNLKALAASNAGQQNITSQSYNLSRKLE